MTLSIDTKKYLLNPSTYSFLESNNKLEIGYFLTF